MVRAYRIYYANDRRGFGKAEYTLTLRLASKLADLQVGYVNPYSSALHSSGFSSLSGSSKRKRGHSRVLSGGCHLLVDFGPRSPSQMTDGSLPSRFINCKSFKVCGFIYSLRQFSEPIFECVALERVQLPVGFVKKEKRALSCPLFLFGGTDGS